MLQSIASGTTQQCHTNEDEARSPSRPRSRLISLRTKAEADAKCELGEVFVSLLPMKCIAPVLK